MRYFSATIAEYVWDQKYRYRLDQKVIDSDVSATWQRVATAIAQAEKPAQRALWAQEFYQILEDFKFLPGGRILAGAGTAHQVTLLNCYVMHIAQDSIKSIFAGLAEGALTLQQGGGVGYDFSVLRPAGAIAKQTGITASGPVSFMRIWNTMCSVIESTGARRGAMMGVLRCDHPDIEIFINAKHDPLELRHFNVSVLITDAFMQAVKDDADWHLVFPGSQSKNKIYRTVHARALWENIIRSAYDTAEPGVLFHDKINKYNNLFYCEEINATNPCGEIPLPAYGACDLGSINLTQFILNPFNHNAQINWQALDHTVSVATRFLDNVLDVSHYPLAKQKNMAINCRRIGLGMTGLADALCMLNLIYGSTAAIEMTKNITQRIAKITWQTSIALAQEKGVFPFYKKDYLRGTFINQFDADILRDVERYGIRNSHHNTIAPAGTISLLANNVSNGIEPIFHGEYNRYVRTPDNARKKMHVEDYALVKWRESNTGEPSAWITMRDLKPAAHLAMQAAAQPFIDNAISKTINLPADFPFADLSDVYTQAYELNLKGCTIFRPNAISGSVLEIPEERCCQIDDENV